MLGVNTVAAFFLVVVAIVVVPSATSPCLITTTPVPSFKGVFVVIRSVLVVFSVVAFSVESDPNERSTLTSLHAARQSSSVWKRLSFP